VTSPVTPRSDRGDGFRPLSEFIAERIAEKFKKADEASFFSALDFDRTKIKFLVQCCDQFLWYKMAGFL
jgi:hypothetical protein